MALPRAINRLPLLGRPLASEAAAKATTHCILLVLHIALIWNVAHHLIRLTAGAVAMIGAAHLPGHHPGFTVASTQGSWSMRATAWTITRYGRTAEAVILQMPGLLEAPVVELRFLLFDSSWTLGCHLQYPLAPQGL